MAMPTYGAHSIGFISLLLLVIVIKSPFPGEPEKVQIAVEGADPLYKEVRVENKLTDKNSAEVRLKERAKVEVTVEARPEDTSAKTEDRRS
jgi:hypothetical protein